MLEFVSHIYMNMIYNKVHFGKGKSKLHPKAADYLENYR